MVSKRKKKIQKSAIEENFIKSYILAYGIPALEKQTEEYLKKIAHSIL